MSLLKKKCAWGQNFSHKERGVIEAQRKLCEEELNNF
jgi:hypothetical protein